MSAAPMSDDVREVRDIALVPGTTLIRRAPGDVALMPVMDVARARQRLEELQELCREYLQESKDGGNDGGDYGVIPGAGTKRNLLKSGADKLCDVYGLADRYVILSKTEDFATGLFDYTIQCELSRKTDELFVGAGLGSCNSYESKYRWRQAQRLCPQCGKATIIKGKAEYGGGWVCLRSKGGCAAKYADDDPVIVNQRMGRTENPDISDTKNTVIKMAKKRAKIDAVISVTRSSGLFTQDFDDDQALPPHQEPVPPSERPPKVITPNQQKKLFAVARQHGWSVAQLKHYLDECGWRSSKEIPSDQYDELLQALEHGGPHTVDETEDGD